MKHPTAFSYLVFWVVSSALNHSFSADLTSHTSTKQIESHSRPVTNESVESGLRQIREALRASPEFQLNDVPTHLRLAKTLSQQGDPNGAIEEYHAVIQLNPLLAKPYRELGAVYIDTHEWEKAEQALRKGIQLNDQNYQAFYWLGRSLMAQDQYIQASDALAQSTLLDPLNAEAHSDLGLALMAQGHFQQATNALQQAIQLQPDFAEAHHRLELVRAAQDDPQQLIQSAQLILHTIFRRE